MTKRTRGAVKSVLCIILLLILIVGTLFGAVIFSGGFYGAIPLYSISYNDTKFYGESTSLGYIPSGAFFAVNAPFEDYEVKILAQSADVNFIRGEEPWQWNLVDGCDFTDGFSIEKTDTGFIVKYDNITDVLGKVMGDKIIIQLDDAHEMFELVISDGNYTYRFPISIDYVPVNDVKIEGENIIL